MSIYVKILLGLLGLAYLISPADIIPEFIIPYLGWLDDGLVLYCLFHLTRFGDLPWFLFRRSKQKPSSPSGPEMPRSSGAGQRTRQTDQKRQAPGTPKRASKQSPAPHDILGVSPGASWEEIHTAYKNEIKKYHPDKVSHLGKEFADLANEKFIAIQKAYDTLKRQRGGGYR